MLPKRAFHEAGTATVVVAPRFHHQAPVLVAQLGSRQAAHERPPNCMPTVNFKLSSPRETNAKGRDFWDKGEGSLKYPNRRFESFEF